MNKKIVIPVVLVAAVLYMNKKTPTKKNNYLYLELPEEVPEELPDRNSPSDNDTPLNGLYGRNWKNSL